MKPKSTARRAFFGTAIFLSCLATPAFAVEVAGNLLIDLDPADYVAGATNWNQHSATAQSIQGPFVKVANATPQKTTVGGATAIVLDGNADYFVGPNTTPALDAAGAPYSVEYWAFQGWAKPEDTVLSWSRRGGPDGTAAAFGYGSNPAFGAAGHWGPGPDIGYAPLPVLGKWHHLVYTYEGTATNVQNVYVDGVLNNTETLTVTLDAKDNNPITIGAQIEGDGAINNTGVQYTGALGKIRIHSAVLTAAQITANFNEEKAGYPGVTATQLPVGPTHRFSFNEAAGPAADGTLVSDSVGGLTGKIRGTGASFTGSKVSIPGGDPATGPAYVDLPNGLISGSQRISIEVWSTQRTNQTWSRIMGFGTTNIGEVTTPGNTPGFGGGAGIYVFAQQGGGLDTALARVGGTIANGSDVRYEVGASVLNVQTHRVVVFDPDLKEWRLYRDGALSQSIPESQGPTTIPDVNNWLGRSEYGGDRGFDGTFDEFRIYNYTLTEGQILGNALQGPEVVNVSTVVAQGSWQPTAAGTFSFNTAANWNPAVVPNGIGAIANLSSNLAGDETVNLDAAITLGTLNLGDTDASNKFTLAAGTGGSLTLNAGSGFAATLSQRGTSAGDTISAPLTLASDLEVANLTAAGGPALTFSGTLSGPGRFFKNGAGPVIITGDNSAFAGGFGINSGVLNLGNGGATGSLPANVVINTPGRLVLNRSNALDLSQTITANGVNSYIQQDGPGEVTVTGTITSGGFLGIKAGTSLVNDNLITVRNLNVNGILAMDQAAASLTVTNDFNVGDLGAGASGILLSDGSISAITPYIGKNAGTTGVIVQTGGTFLDAIGGGDGRIGGAVAAASDAFGAFRALGGTTTFSGNFQIGAYGTGIMEVAGGSVAFSNGGFPVIARFQTPTSESYGLLDISSGSVAQNVAGAKLIVAEEGFGVLNVRGTGTLNCVGGLLVGATNAGGTGDGTVNLSDSAVITTQVVDQGDSANANGVFNFHGGTLKALNDNATFFQNVDLAPIWSEGLIIDSNGKSVSISQSFSDPVGQGVASVPVSNGGTGYLAAPFVEITGGGGSGATAVAALSTAGVVTGITVTNPGQGYTSAPSVSFRGGVGGTGLAAGTPTLAANAKGNFTKLGTGRVTLTGGQTYTGNTIVSAGTLAIDSTYPAAGAGTVTVGPNGTLAGTGLPRNIVVNGTLSPGDPTGKLLPDSVTFGAGSKLLIHIDDSQTDPAKKNGSVDALGNVDISNVNLLVSVAGGGAATAASYEIFTTTGSIVGNFASVPAGVEYTISGGTITLTKVGTPFQSFIGGYFPGVTDQAIVGPDADPDNDGSSNQVEFALGGIPNKGGDGPKIRTFVADSSDAGTAKELLMTIAVLQGTPPFMGTPSPEATYKGVNYQIQGSLDLMSFASQVMPVDTVVGDLPTVPGYEYRTFSLTASDGLPNKGFLRVQVK